MRHTGERARSLLKVLENQTYICQDAYSLDVLCSALQRVSNVLSQSLPRDTQGLFIIPSDHKDQRRKDALKVKTLQHLGSLKQPKRRGRMTSRWTNRVGAKADRFRYEGKECSRAQGMFVPARNSRELLC